MQYFDPFRARSTGNVSATTVPEVDVEALGQARNGRHFLLDVREPEEFHEVHVPGALLIPLGQVAERIDEIPTDDDIYVICRSGGRSAQAVELLSRSGILSKNVAGGTLAWIEAGYDVSVGNESS